MPDTDATDGIAGVVVIDEGIDTCGKVGTCGRAGTCGSFGTLGVADCRLAAIDEILPFAPPIAPNAGFNGARGRDGIPGIPFAPGSFFAKFFGLTLPIEMLGAGGDGKAGTDGIVGVDGGVGTFNDEMLVRSGIMMAVP